MRGSSAIERSDDASDDSDRAERGREREKRMIREDSPDKAIVTRAREPDEWSGVCGAVTADFARFRGFP
jgi:hypothetical protein